MVAPVHSRCADLDRLDGESIRADEHVQRALEKLRELRRSSAPNDEVQAAQQAVVDARLQATAARRSARQLGSGEPGDHPKAGVSSGKGELISVYA